MTQILINGRFLSQRTTGVQRFAREITVGIDHLLGQPGFGGLDVKLALPKGTSCPLSLSRIEVLPAGRLHGNIWEQAELPLLRPDATLINLGSTAPLRRRRQFVTIHDMSAFANADNYSRLFRSWYRFLQPRIARGAQRVITVSNFSASEIAAYCGVPAGKMLLIHNGVDHIDRIATDTSVFERLPVQRRGYLLAVGNLSPNKNIAATIRALERLRPEGIDLPLVVVGTKQGIFADGTVPVSDPSRTLSAGYVTDEQLRALYENAAGLVFPSLYEGWGIPVMEAMKLGCPVIASNQSVLPETCGDAALLCDPYDPDSIARQIKALLTIPGLADRLRAKGRQRAAQFSWQRSARTLLAEAAAGMPRPRLYDAAE